MTLSLPAVIGQAAAARVWLRYQARWDSYLRPALWSRCVGDRCLRPSASLQMLRQGERRSPIRICETAGDDGRLWERLERIRLVLGRRRTSSRILMR